MGAICSKGEKKKPVPDAAKKDNVRRPRQEAKRKQSQEFRRPKDQQQIAELSQDFEAQGALWPSRPAWYKSGKYQQGINIIFADPEPLRNTIVPIVLRNRDKYSVTFGFANETVFDTNAMRLGIHCSTVSGTHCRLNFRRSEKTNLSVIEIEDMSSLNGTFVLWRPPKRSKTRPMLEKEVRDSPMNLENIEYIRLGSACVMALDATNMFWDDAEEDDESSDEEVQEVFKTDMVSTMMDEGWYIPAPTDAKVKEITMKKRAEPKKTISGSVSGGHKQAI